MSSTAFGFDFETGCDLRKSQSRAYRLAELGGGCEFHSGVELQLGRQGMSALPIVAGASVVVLDQRDQSRLSELCRHCTDFFQLVQGQSGGSETAAEILGPFSAEESSGTKRVFGIERRGALVGVAELLDGFPAPNDWYVGLLLVLPAARGKGLGDRRLAGPARLDARATGCGCSPGRAEAERLGAHLLDEEGLHH